MGATVRIKLEEERGGDFFALRCDESVGGVRGARMGRLDWTGAKFSGSFSTTELMLNFIIEAVMDFFDSVFRNILVRGGLMISRTLFISVSVGILLHLRRRSRRIDRRVRMEELDGVLGSRRAEPQKSFRAIVRGFLLHGRVRVLVGGHLRGQQSRARWWQQLESGRELRNSDRFDLNCEILIFKIELQMEVQSQLRRCHACHATILDHE